LECRLDAGRWRKSSYSAGNGGDCVESCGAHGTILVRDSKNRHGPVLRFDPGTWRAFATEVKTRKDSGH
jgi:hypothetical protein